MKEKIKHLNLIFKNQGDVIVKIVEPSFEIIEDQLEKPPLLDSVYLP